MRNHAMYVNWDHILCSELAIVQYITIQTVGLQVVWFDLENACDGLGLHLHPLMDDVWMDGYI